MHSTSKEIKIVKKDSVRDEFDLAVDIGTNITRARLIAGYTQVELAKKMGATQPSLARYERGSKMPSNHFLLRVANVLKTNVIAPTFESVLNHQKNKFCYGSVDYTPHENYFVRVNVVTEDVSDKSYPVFSHHAKWSVSSAISI